MKPKDRVTLNKIGREFIRGGGFPSPVGALYVNILNNTAMVLETEKDTVWIKMINKSFPYHSGGQNRFGVSKAHLKVIDEVNSIRHLPCLL
ncbi:MAG: hypothetical protein ACE5D0_08140 [Fidelibacterota bacterium]